MALPTGEITLDMEPSGGSLQPTIITHSIARTNHYTRSGGNPSSSTEPIPTQHSNPGQKLEVNLDDYLPLYRAASRGNWEEARKFLDTHPNSERAKISNSSMTALHVAACEGHSEFVEKLVKRVPADVLEMLDGIGYTALHYAAIGGNLRSAKALLGKNPKLTQRLDSAGRTALLLAATFASENKELVWYLLLVTKREKPGLPSTGPLAANLVNVLIASGFPDVLARNKSNFLSGSRLGSWESCIYPFLPVEVDCGPPHSVRASVARHESVQSDPSEQYRVHWLRRMLFGAIKRIARAGFMRLHDAKLRHHCAVELLRQICLQLSQEQVKSDILEIAATNGIVEFIRTLVEFFPDLMWFILSKDRYLLLPFAIEFRHENLFRIVCGKTARSKLIASTLLKSESGGTILHLAAKLAPLPQLSSVSCPALQMQRELQWFKVVEKLVHPYYKDNLNKKGETARELFTKEHKELAQRGEKWLKDTSNSCMLVATLIATVVFAAAFTVPGGNDNDGSPNLLRKNSSTFMVFVVSDAIALFASLTSLLMFLSILTARYAEEDFLQSLPRRLMIGLASLFFAIASMMVAFGATIVLVLNNRFNWVSITITSLATCLVALFAMLQLPLFIQMVRSTFGQSIFRPENIDNSMDLCKKDA
ncbi:ankyrin repeat-containing protein At5g02620 isoform X2 [Prunus persica]|uniref:ankyrin repeat-containing protein At5g02620 isoform X2 n=1 Tax=Prunus persica TaxID=3760 RepID=UPI0009AB73F2|nr:ankyrin repeat-containing protein At5g02620 isoform X2 [Prunus persica]